MKTLELFNKEYAWFLRDLKKSIPKQVYKELLPLILEYYKKFPKVICMYSTDEDKVFRFQNLKLILGRINNHYYISEKITDLQMVSFNLVYDYFDDYYLYRSMIAPNVLYDLFLLRFLNFRILVKNIKSKTTAKIKSLFL
jgi:hypothetical protein